MGGVPSVVLALAVGAAPSGGAKGRNVEQHLEAGQVARDEGNDHAAVIAFSMAYAQLNAEHKQGDLGALLIDEIVDIRQRLFEQTGKPFHLLEARRILVEHSDALAAVESPRHGEVLARLMAIDAILEKAIPPPDADWRRAESPVPADSTTPPSARDEPPDLPPRERPEVTDPREPSPALSHQMYMFGLGLWGAAQPTYQTSAPSGGDDGVVTGGIGASMVVRAEPLRIETSSVATGFAVHLRGSAGALKKERLFQVAARGRVHVGARTWGAAFLGYEFGWRAGRRLALDSDAGHVPFIYRAHTLSAGGLLCPNLGDGVGCSSPNVREVKLGALIERTSLPDPAASSLKSVWNPGITAGARWRLGKIPIIVFGEARLIIPAEIVGADVGLATPPFRVSADITVGAMWAIIPRALEL